MLNPFQLFLHSAKVLHFAVFCLSISQVLFANPKITTKPFALKKASSSWEQAVTLSLNDPQKLASLIQQIPNDQRLRIVRLFCLNGNFSVAQQIAQNHTVKKTQNAELYFDLEWINCFLRFLLRDVSDFVVCKLYHLYKMTPSKQWKAKAIFLLGHIFLKRNNLPQALKCFAKAATWTDHFYGILGKVQWCQLAMKSWNVSASEKLCLKKTYPFLPQDVVTAVLEFACLKFPLISPNILQILIHSLVKVESNFNPSAVSPAGAQGLMQLMPETAKLTFKALVDAKIADKNERYNLQNWPDNLVLGITHLCQLISDYNGNLILVASAYNSGKTNTDKWIKAFGNPGQFFSSWCWVELIPFRETRNYIRQIIESFFVYSTLFKIPFTSEVLGIM